MEDSFSTVEGIQYIGGISSVHMGVTFSTCGGLASVLWGNNVSTVEAIQYCGDKDLKYYVNVNM